MSVINRVLVDLEKRHAHAEGSHAGTPEVRAIGVEPGRAGRKTLVGVLFVLAAAVIATIAWQWTGQSPRPQQPSPVVLAPPAPAPAPAPVPVPAPPAAPAPALANAPTPIVMPAPISTPVPAPIATPAPVPVNAPASTSDPAAASAPATRTAPAIASAPATPAPARAAPAAVAAPPLNAVELPAPRVSAPPNAKDPELAPASREARPIARASRPPARPDPAATASPEPPAEPAIEKRERALSAAERAEGQFRQGAISMQRGRMHDAEASFLAAIAEDPGHVPSRQALLGLYLEAQRKDEAEVLLRDGLRSGTRPPSWAMVLARLEADRGDLAGAIITMQNHFDIGRQNGDYGALLAALFQRQGRHKEAVDQYQSAIGLGAAKPAWFMGQGISLRELGRREEARAAFQRALDSGGLSSELKLFVERQVAALRLPPSN